MIQMNGDPVEIISPERTTRASLFPVRRKHEMVDHQLASAFKQLRQGHLSIRPFKDIVLFYLDPGQLPALPAQLIAETSKLFLLAQKLFSGLQPFVCRNDLVLLEVCLDHIVITVVQKVLLNAQLEIWPCPGADRLKEPSAPGRTMKRKIAECTCEILYINLLL